MSEGHSHIEETPNTNNESNQRPHAVTRRGFLSGLAGVLATSGAAAGIKEFRSSDKDSSDSVIPKNDQEAQKNELTSITEIKQNLLPIDEVRSGNFGSIFESLKNYRKKIMDSRGGQDPLKYYLLNQLEEGSLKFDFADQDSDTTPDVMDLQLVTVDGKIKFHSEPSLTGLDSREIEVSPNLKGKDVRVVRILGSEYGDNGTTGRLAINHRGEYYYGGAFYGLISSEKNDSGSVENFFINPQSGERLGNDQAPICFTRFYAA